MSILVIAEHDNQHLKPATLHAITAATQLGGDVDVLVAGHQCATVGAEAAAVLGVTRVRVADAAHYAEGLAEELSALVQVQATGYTHVLAAASSFGKNLLPRVAALLDAAQVSEVIAIESADTFQRPIYAGNAIATVRSSDPIKVLTIRASAFAAALASGNQAPIENVAAAPLQGISRVVGRELALSERPELGNAKVVVAGGRGLGSGDNYHKLLEPLADKLGAALGASRAAVDAGYAPNDYQVGQTGKVVAPELYIAIGISGAIQHLAGMKDSRVIVAINKDADAPIFQIADYGLVGDLFELVPQLTTALG